MSDNDLDLVAAIVHALGEIPSGPTLGEFGIAREDCALVHIDYFHCVSVAANLLAQALADHQGAGIEAIHYKYSPPVKPCDCESCVGKEKAAAARERHRQAYTNVKEWVQ